MSLSRKDIAAIIYDWRKGTSCEFGSLKTLPEKLVDSRKGIRYIHTGSEESNSSFFTKDNERCLVYFDVLCRRNYKATYRMERAGLIERLSFLISPYEK